MSFTLIPAMRIKVKANLEKTIQNRNTPRSIFEIRVPMEEHIEEKNGRRKLSCGKFTRLRSG